MHLRMKMNALTVPVRMEMYLATAQFSNCVNAEGYQHYRHTEFQRHLHPWTHLDVKEDDGEPGNK